MVGARVTGGGVVEANQKIASPVVEERFSQIDGA